MSRLRSLLFTTLLGGLAVILPLLLFVALVRWLVGLLRSLAEPLTGLLADHIGAAAPLLFLITVAALVAACFVTGLVVRTRFGALLHEHFETWLGRIAPGYRMVRDTVVQLLGTGDRNALRGEVALVRLYGAQAPAAQIAIVTARHAGGGFTVYVPTAPLPTQGFVYHLPGECVQLLPQERIEVAMRMVFACGAGAAEMFANVSTEEGQPFPIKR